MFLHHTKSKGDLAIFKSQLDLYEKGYTVLLPFEYCGQKRPPVRNIKPLNADN